MRRLLMVAFHFPPVHGSSGLQRSVSFARYLPEYGWEPLILSAHPRAYGRTSDDQMGDLADDLVVRRAFALDTARHLSIGGRYLRGMAVPDRWVGWCLGAVPAGLAMIRRYRPQAIWATYPIATAHLIGLLLSRLSGVPLLADYRDSMTEAHWPKDPTIWKAYRGIERRVVARSVACVFTAPGARRMYLERYPQLESERMHVVENGYDEAAFAGAQRACTPADAPVRLLHSGLVYPAERDPTALLDAIARLREEGDISPETFSLALRATGNDALFADMIAARSLESFVSLEPGLPYREALAEMMQASGLLVMQSRGCNHQIPAKLYEYVRTRRPILGLTDADGDTAATLRAAGVDMIADLKDSAGIATLLKSFLARHRSGTLRGASEAAVAAASRQARTAELVAVLDRALNA